MFLARIFTLDCIEDTNEIHTKHVQIANSYNDYFTTIADKIISKQKNRYQGNKNYRDYLSNQLLENFIFSDCDEDEIENILNSFKLGKSLGPNSIPTKILNHLGKCSVNL